MRRLTEVDGYLIKYGTQNKMKTKPFLNLIYLKKVIY